ncbi:MAG: O-methyltransferase [Thermoleophilaceae bacterium]|nr:O-methyltransferase [Thermoleophilaceae bacterium]
MPTFTRNARKLWRGWRWRLEYMVGTPIPPEYDEELAATIRSVRRHTLSSAARIATLVDAVEYVVANDIEGDLVECGVWRGGSMMAAALTLKNAGQTGRDLHLFDTFSGMPEPGEADVPSPYDGYSPKAKWERKKSSGWAAVGAADVRQSLLTTGYPAERLHLVQGMVEDTLPALAPEKISLLRLDTDWYESTKHELEQLFPRLVVGGVLIVDDYGHYEGARRAVDEYFAESGQQVLLSRIDYTGRIAIKQAPNGRVA